MARIEKSAYELELERIALMTEAGQQKPELKEGKYDELFAARERVAEAGGIVVD